MAQHDKMTDLQITYRKTAELTAYPRNSRTHSEEQIAQIQASLKEFGWTNPVLIDEEGGIIAGHGRVEAAKGLGMEEVPTVTLAGMTEAQKRAYVIADNQLALNAGWDKELLKLELHALDELDFDLTLTGFDAEELTDLMFDLPPTEPGDEGEVNFVVQYNIVFDNEPQQETWFSFVRWLKANNPNADTLGERLEEFIKEHNFVAD